MEFSNNIQELINKYPKSDNLNFQRFIGTGGYISSNSILIENIVVAIALGKNVLLKGPTGSGKTKLAETVSHIFQKPMHMINCSIDLDSESMLGFKTLDYQENKQIISFVDGSVTKAMINGHFLYIDEINMAKPETLPILNGVLDYRRSITNPFTQEFIQAKKGFGVIAAINEGYVGTTPLNEALKNRFVIVEVPYIQGEELKKLILQNSLLKDDKKINLFVSLSKDLITGVGQGKVSEDTASIRALLDACDMSCYISLEQAVETSIVAKAEDDREKNFIRNIVDMLK